MAILFPSRLAACWLPVLWLALAAAACGGDDDNELAGSISEAGYSLQFDRVQVSRSNERLLIQYVASETLGGGQALLNQPVRIEVDLSAQTLVVDRALDIPGDATIEHAVIALDSLGQPVDEPDFPRVSDGELSFNDLGEAIGEKVAGEFSCLFENSFTLNGRFSAKLSAP